MDIQLFSTTAAQDVKVEILRFSEKTGENILYSGSVKDCLILKKSNKEKITLGAY